MNHRHVYSCFLALSLGAACAQPRPEQQFITDAADALGGRSRIQAVQTLTIEGEGVNYNLGQDMKPDAATQQFTVTGYKRQMDFRNHRQRVEQTRTPKFAYFQGPQPQQQIQGLDNQVAFNVNAAGASSRLGSQGELDRRADFYHHPVALVRAVLDTQATVGNVRQVGTVRQADVTTSGGTTVTMSIDAAGVPLSISSKSYNINLGDVVITTTFGEYQDVSGLTLPAQFTGKVDDFTTWQIHATKQTLDADVDIAAPASASHASTAAAAPAVTVEQLGKGVWWLAGQSHHSVLVEFSDHLMLIEAPQNEARTLAVIAKAKELVPGKPLQQVVTTHHHFDHTAGLRAAIAEGLTVITQSGNRAWVEAMAKRPHTRQPDALAKNEQRLVVETVDGEREYKDQTMTVMLYHVEGNPHSDTMLMAYIPRDRVLIEADAFSPGSAVNPYAANLLENIQKRKLRVDRVVPLHGTIAPMSELEKVAKP